MKKVTNQDLIVEDIFDHVLNALETYTRSSSNFCLIVSQLASDVARLQALEGSTRQGAPGSARALGLRLEPRAHPRGPEVFRPQAKLRGIPGEPN